MKIELKPNNLPTKTGTYYVAYPHEQVQHAAQTRVVMHEDKLCEVLCNGSLNYLSECDPEMLWSDAVTFIFAPSVPQQNNLAEEHP